MPRKRAPAKTARPPVFANRIFHGFHALVKLDLATILLEVIYTKNKTLPTYIKKQKLQAFHAMMKLNKTTIQIKIK
jgi:hypothetical protein